MFCMTKEQFFAIAEYRLERCLSQLYHDKVELTDSMKHTLHEAFLSKKPLYEVLLKFLLVCDTEEDSAKDTKGKFLSFDYEETVEEICSRL